MKAVIIYECGGPEVTRLVHDHPVPVRGPRQVKIKTSSVGVNPVDLLVRSAPVPVYKPTVFPKVLGGDVAGYVEEADAGSKFKNGDKVFALTPGFIRAPDEEYNAGTYAEYVIADEEWLAFVPDNLPMDRAAGLPLAALTAWQALQQAKPQAGQRIVITAASGGVGHLAVQIAKALGLYVVALAGPNNLEWVRSLGADEAVDYTSQDVEQHYKDAPFDIAFDLMGNRSDLLRKLLAVLKPGGHLSEVRNAGTDPALLEGAQAAHAAGEGPSVSTTIVQPNGTDLQQIADLVAAGKVRLEVALSLPLEEFQQAHTQIATGHTRGKVVLRYSAMLRLIPAAADPVTNDCLQYSNGISTEGGTVPKLCTSHKTLQKSCHSPHLTNFHLHPLTQWAQSAPSTASPTAKLFSGLARCTTCLAALS